MTPATKSTAPKATASKAHRIHWLPRVVLILFGLLGVATGAVAVFIPGTSESGGVALIVGGVVVLVLGVIGLSPLRISGKEWSVEFFDEVVDAIDSAPNSVQQEIADKLFLEGASGGLDATSRLAGAVQSNIAFQNHALKTIYSEFARIASYDFELNTTAEYDAVLQWQGRAVAVEVKKSPNQSSIEAVRQKIRAESRRGDFAGLILIVQDDDVVRRFARASDTDERFWLVSQSNLDLLPKVLIRWGFDVAWG